MARSWRISDREFTAEIDPRTFLIDRESIRRRLGRTVVFLVLALVALPSARAADAPLHVTPGLCERSVSSIRRVLDREHRFVKVHAAEYLLSLGYPQGVEEAFHKELQTHGGELQYRIGIWRVLARCDTRGPEPSEWTDKIRDVLRNPSAPDRVHAGETLAKLGYRLRDDEAASLEEAARPDSAPLTPYALWVLANSDWPGAEGRLAELLDSSDVDARLGAAYALRHLPSVSAPTEEKLLAVARRERSGSKAKVYLLAAAAIHATPDRRASLTAELADFAAKGNREEKVESCQTLAEIGGDSDLSLLTRLLDDSDPDLRVQRRPMPF